MNDTTCGFTLRRCLLVSCNQLPGKVSPNCSQVQPLSTNEVVTICGYGLGTIDEFGVTTLRENVPGIYMLPRAGGYQLVHGPGSKRS